MLIEAILLAIIFGFLLGGNLKNLEKIKLEKAYLVLIAFSIEYISGYFLNSTNMVVSNFFSTYTYFIQLLVYILLAIFFKYNYKYLGMQFIIFGSVLNFIVIQLNNGYMPVDIGMSLRLGYYDSVSALMSGNIFAHKVLEIGEGSMLILADIINIPPPYLFPKTISIGDIFIGLGAFFLIFLNMMYSKKMDNPI